MRATCTATAISFRGSQGTWPQVRDRLNSLLRGWGSYFNHGTRQVAYRAVNDYVYHSVRRFLRRRHKVRSLGTRRFNDEVVHGGYGVLRLRPFPLVRCRQPGGEASRKAGCRESARPVR